MVACVIRCAARGCSRREDCSFHDGFLDLMGVFGVMVVVTQRWSL